MRTASIRIIIADDEPLARQRLRSLLGRHGDLEIVAECANGPEVLAAVPEHRPDMLFLDVEMPGGTGVQALAALGEAAPPVVVFVTAYSDHAVHAFEHHALDYVLKPVDEERFDRALARARERLAEKATGALTREVLRRLGDAGESLGGQPPVSQARTDRFLVRTGGKLRFVPVGDVEWIEADGDYVRLHAGKSSHLLRSTLAAVESQLDAGEFVRIHRSTLVRVARIREMEPYYRGEYIVVLESGARLKLSRSYRERLQTALGHVL